MTKMKFTRNRQSLANGVGWASLNLGHHIENAARAIVYRGQGNIDMARWYAAQARMDLKSYLKAKDVTP